MAVTGTSRTCIVYWALFDMPFRLADYAFCSFWCYALLPDDTYHDSLSSLSMGLLVAFWKPKLLPNLPNSKLTNLVKCTPAAQSTSVSLMGVMDPILQRLSPGADSSVTPPGALCIFLDACRTHGGLAEHAATQSCARYYTPRGAQALACPCYRDV